MKNILLSDNLIIIGPNYIKRKLFELNNMKYNIKFFSIQEFIHKYSYEYKSDALVYLKKKYNYIPEIGKIILDNLYEIDKIYNSKKLKELYDIKKDLEENEYIIYNNFFKTYLNNKNILVFNYGLDSYTLKLIEELKKNNNVSIINRENVNRESLDIYKFNTIEDEVIFLAKSIKELIENNVDINKIKINKVNDEYISVVNRVLGFYGIPINLKSDNKLYYLSDVKMFLDKVEDNMDILSLNEIITELNINDKVKEYLSNIINKYTNYQKVRDVKEILIYDLKNTDFNIEKYKNIVEMIDYKSYLSENDEYIFMLGFNQGILPIIHTDDKYLSDKELLTIKSYTSFDRNKLEKERLLNFINNTKNIIISYKLSSNFNEYTPSTYIKDLESIMKVNIYEGEYDYKNEPINKLLLGKKLDNYVTYNVINNDLEKLFSTYPDIEYSVYNNNYNGIDYKTIKNKLNNKINLSFSNINTFYKCSFRFLLNDIFKLGSYKETNSIVIGKIFHEVLCIVYKEKLNNYDDVISKVIDKYYENPSKKDLFYIEKYKKAILKLIDILTEELSKTSYENAYFEEFFSIDKSNDLEIKVVGIIDKIMTLNDGENTYVIVVDYKTGVLHGDFNKVIYGLDMQLLMYLYLIKNTNKIKNPKFTGMYLQSIMCDILNKDDKKTYDELLKDNMKLNGYTIDRLDLLKEIDHDYDDTSYIKGIKVKKDGTFYAYSKVLSEDNINSLLDIVDDRIKEVIDSIKNTRFDINPKKIENTNIGCEYCEFGDICYMNNNNIIDLKKHENLDFIGGDNNDTK